MIGRLFLRQTSLLQQSNKFSGLAHQSMYNFAKFSDRLSNVRNKPTVNVDIPHGSAAQEVVSNAGLNSFVTRVYKASGAGVMTALATSQLAISAGLPFTSPGACVLGGLVATLGGIFGTMKMSPTQYVENVNGSEYLRTENSPLRIGLFGLGMVGLGVSSSPLFAMLAMKNSVILPTAIGISSAIFGSASIYAYTRPKDSLLTWGSSLYGALFGMIGLQVVGGITQLCIGPNMFSMCLHRVDTFAGVGLFSALVAYDTHVAIKQYNEGNADHLLVAVDFALDFWNILSRVSQILYMFTGND